MNRLVPFIFGLIILFQFNCNAQAVGANFDYAPFYSKEAGTYVETYISFSGKSLRYILNTDSILDASVEVTMLFKNADEIIEFRKYKLVSPPIIEPENGFPDFIDLQRISIPEGIYNFELIIKDNFGADSIKPFKTNQLITVDIPEKELALSGIELLERYEQSEKGNIYIKDGYECIPFGSDLFTKESEYLRFYVELYNASKALGSLEVFSFAVQIEETNTSKPIKEFYSSEIQQAVNKNFIFKEINIKKLPTGKYYLILEVRDKQNNIILSSKKFFQRANFEPIVKKIDLKQIVVENNFVAQYTNADTLIEYIRAIRPICDFNERIFIDSTLQGSNLKMMQQFFYNFWYCRNEKNPENAWNNYLTNIKIVEQQFKTSRESGFETDRGKVYLQLGPPNSIFVENSDTAAFPNEIWDYYKIADQTNIRFIFIGKSQMPNDYELLHSNMKAFRP